MTQETTEKKSKRLRWFFGTILKLVLSVFTLVVLLSFLIHIPFVQQWSIHKIGNYLTSKLETRVSIQAVDFNIFRHLTLEQVLVEDPYTPGDTLIHTEELELRFRNLFSLLNKRITFNRVRLVNPELRLSRTDISGPDNLGFLLSKLSSDKEEAESTGSRFQLRFRQVELLNAHVQMENTATKGAFDARLKRGAFTIRELDLGEQVLDIRNVKLEQPYVHLRSPAEPSRRVKPPPGNKLGQWNIVLNRLEVHQGVFQRETSGTPRGAERGIDFNNLEVGNIELHLENAIYASEKLELNLNSLSFAETLSGFTLENLQASRFVLDTSNVALAGMLLKTEHSLIQDTLKLEFSTFEDFARFADEVTIHSNFEGSQIGIPDILAFAPQLWENPFFRQNSGAIARIEGNIDGRLNRIRVNDLHLEIGKFKLAGDIRARDITRPGQELINLDLKELTFPISTLEELVPNLALPPQFNSLGQVQFSGNFDGFFKDFVADGKFRSNIGRADLDMRLNLVEGRENATYTGNVRFVDFNLGKWSGNPSLGKISANLQVKDGRGLTGQSAKAKLEGNILRLGLNGYEYKNVVLNGNLEKNLFDGEASIHEENIDLVFQGTVDLTDSVPAYSFRAQIDTLDLQALKMLKQPLAFSGDFDVDVRGDSLRVLEGDALIYDLVISKSPQETFLLDSIYIEAQNLPDERQRLSLESDLVNGFIDGIFDIPTLPRTFLRELKENYPALFREVEVADSLVVPDSDFSFDLVFTDMQNLLAFSGLDQYFIQGLDISGDFATQGTVDITMTADAFGYKNFHFYGIDGILENRERNGHLKFDVVAADISEKVVFENILLDAELLDSTVVFDFRMLHVGDFFDTLRIPGSLDFADQVYTFRLAPTDIQILDRSWQLDANNAITIAKDSFHLQGLSLTSGEQYVIIDNYQSAGLSLEVGGFNADLLNDIWVYENLHFEGEYTMYLRVLDVKDFSGINLQLDIPNLTINDEPYGALDLDAKSVKDARYLNVNCLLRQEEMSLHATGAYYPPLKYIDSLDRNRMDLAIDLKQFPLRFFEFILGAGIRETVGTGTGEITLAGPMGDMDLGGHLRLDDGATTIDILGTRYFFDDQTVTLTNTAVDATGVEIRDVRGNKGVITGGLTHRRFKRFGLDARINGTNISLLNTSRSEDQMFYGTVYGTVDVRFYGSMVRPNIDITGTTSVGSYLAIPLDVADSGSKEEFLQFVGSGDTTTLNQPDDNVQITGVSIDMEITVNDNAIIELIFDEKSGEILRSQGNGNISLILTREGEFLMYGRYEIEEGTYLFTNFATNKSFIIRRGSSIQWTGDPFEAQIRVKADYSEIRTSLSTFLAEYLVNASEQAKEEANIQTDVDLTLIITGSLLAPEINFDISFPEVSGELTGFINSKMRILQSNPNALNEQVFGLLWLGTFLPSSILSGSQGNQSIAKTGIISTLTEFGSNWVSNLLSNLLSGAVENVNFISGVDVNVGYNNVANLTEQDLNYQEWEFRLKNRLFNDRVILDVGGNYVTDSPIGGTYFAGDFAIEYVLTKDRRLKIRFSHRNDLTIEGQKKYKYGIGLSYRREFDSFEEFLKGMKKDVENVSTPEAKQEEGAELQE